MISSGQGSVVQVLNSVPVRDEAISAADAARLRVMVVDDSAAQRRMLSGLLERWGCTAIEAPSAEYALRLLETQSVDVILSDWMMPGMDGPEFCRQFRKLERCGYGYFILLTSKSGKAEVAEGLEAGADDFVIKPVSGDELRARLRAGERIIAMQLELQKRNRQVEETLERLQNLYDALERDLIEAKKLQQSLLRDRFRDFGAATVDLMIRPASHIGGDLVGCLNLDPTRVAIWAVDVSGHGVASAMMTARLAGCFSGNAPEHNLAFYRAADGSRALRSPAEVVTAFNELMLDELQVDQYFTMVYAEVCLETGTVRLAQAGHPHPLLIRQNGSLLWVGRGGHPVGLLADARYETLTLKLGPGDRLLLMSDGVTECVNHAGRELGPEGVEKLVAELRGLPGAALLESMIWQLETYSEGSAFQDDISALLFTYRGKSDAPATPPV